MAVPGDGDLAAGDAPGVDVAGLQVLGDPLELSFVQARAGRVPPSWRYDISGFGVVTGQDQDQYRGTGS